MALKFAACVGGLALAACRTPLGPSVPEWPVERLTLTAALPIEAPQHFQPSALALDGGRLLAVSDRDDATVYELELGEAAAQARPYVTFSGPGDVSAEGVSAGRGPVGPLDFEGLARVGERRFWVLSEGRYRVLEVAAVGGLPGSGAARWLTASVESLGRSAGLFQVPGGDVEGLLRLPQGGLLIAAEREPRGLIELPLDFELGRAQVWAMPVSAYPVPRQRPPDFADLTLVDGEVFALVRNAHLVVRLARTSSGWREGPAWSYAAVENDPRFVYADAKFGMGEGLAVSDREVFVVLDNNEQPRRAAPADHRALLFRFERPRDLASAQ